MRGKQNLFQNTAVIALLAVVVTLLWGSAFPCVKLGYELFGIETTADRMFFAGARFTFAGLLTILFACAVKRAPVLPEKGTLGGVLAIGFVQTTLEYLFFYISLAHITGVKGSIIDATNTFMAVGLAHLFFRDERLTAPKTAGCLLGFAGVVVVNLGGGELGGGFTLLGEGFMLLAAAAFAVGAVISRRVAARGDSMAITGYQLLFGGAALLAAGLLAGGRLRVVTGAGLWMLLYLAALSSVAFTLWTALIKHNGVGRIAIYNCLTPVFGVLLSGLLLGEAFLDWKNLGALLLVCAGIYLVNRPAEGKRA